MFEHVVYHCALFFSTIVLQHCSLVGSERQPSGYQEANQQRSRLIIARDDARRGVHRTRVILIVSRPRIDKCNRHNNFFRPPIIVSLRPYFSSLHMYACLLSSSKFERQFARFQSSFRPSLQVGSTNHNAVARDISVVSTQYSKTRLHISR